ncbi:GNAT family N-acetyltransferase [Trinickia dinghuensis]|uniref:N-acetyltransferase n=1 Tax=Trinickia dinghuensis TaxID=2291023 RepID=A0A3D8JQ51_9BURK|nr:GNAT family N-acetyltransferase [Trinickia dinghuensis]RDU95148.1 N-acetyltransferase [Trinickia dinghuensis]
MLDSTALFSVHAVSAEYVRPLRRTILLDNQTDSSRFRGDDEPTTLHVAIYRSERIIAVATVCREALPGSQDDTAWRLRGVAVEEHARGYGFGRTLMKACFDHARRHGGRLAWCTARETARGFYEALGFASSSPPFKLPSRGDLLFYEMHYVLPGGPISDVE